MNVMSLLGFAQAAGKLVSGDYASMDALASGRGRFVLIAKDAADRTKRHFMQECIKRQVPVMELATKADLGKAIGKPNRAVIVVCDPGFARSIRASLDRDLSPR